VSQLNYLGLVIGENFNWQEHIEHLCKKLSMSSMQFYNLKFILPTDIMIMLYKSLVHSIIDYGVNVWGLTSKTHLDKVQKLQEKCIKSALWSRF